MQKISPPPEFYPHPVQSAATCYTDHAIQAYHTHINTISSLHQACDHHTPMLGPVSLSETSNDIHNLTWLQARQDFLGLFEYGYMLHGTHWVKVPTYRHRPCERNCDVTQFAVRCKNKYSASAIRAVFFCAILKYRTLISIIMIIVIIFRCPLSQAIFPWYSS
jgi:hypothetical protein